MNPLLGDLAQPGQRKNLEPPAVGENRTIPAHEAVQPPHALDQLFSGTNVKVVGVAEKDLRPERTQLVRRHRFHRRLRAHGHEHRREDLPATGFQNSGPRLSLCRLQRIRARHQQ